MADLLGTDEFLVNRNDVTYTQQQETLMATLQDTDHLLINRAGQTYKITGSDLINSVIDPLEVTVILAPIEGYTDTEVTAVPVVSGGKQPDGGYIFSYQWVTADDAAGTNKTNIAGETNATFTPTAAQVGKYLGCVVSTTDALGTSAEGEAYIGPIQVLAAAPVIADVVVSEIYDGANRFTDKEFPYITTMAVDGEPNPTYEIKAKVSGTTFDFDVVSDTITKVDAGGSYTCETDVITNVASPTDWTQYGDANGGIFGEPWEYMFNNEDLPTVYDPLFDLTVLGLDDAFIPWKSDDVKAPSVWDASATGGITVNDKIQFVVRPDVDWFTANTPGNEGYIKVNGNPVTLVNNGGSLQNLQYAEISSADLGGSFDKLEFVCSDQASNFAIRIWGFYVDGKLFKDGDTVLTLDGDKDLDCFEPGDVAQGDNVTASTYKVNTIDQDWVGSTNKSYTFGSTGSTSGTSNVGSGTSGITAHQTILWEFDTSTKINFVVPVGAANSTGAWFSSNNGINWNFVETMPNPPGNSAPADFYYSPNATAKYFALSRAAGGYDPQNWYPGTSSSNVVKVVSKKDDAAPYQITVDGGEWQTAAEVANQNLDQVWSSSTYCSGMLDRNTFESTKAFNGKVEPVGSATASWISDNTGSKEKFDVTGLFPTAETVTIYYMKNSSKDLKVNGNTIAQSGTDNTVQKVDVDVTGDGFNTIEFEYSLGLSAVFVDGIQLVDKGVGGETTVTGKTTSWDASLTVASTSELDNFTVGDSVKMGLAADVPYQPVSDAITNVSGEAVTYPGFYGCTFAPKPVSGTVAIRLKRYTGSGYNQTGLIMDQTGTWRQVSPDRAGSNSGIAETDDITALLTSLGVTSIQGIAVTGNRPEPPSGGSNTATAAFESFVIDGVDIRGSSTVIIDVIGKDTVVYPNTYTWQQFMPPGGNGAVGEGSESSIISDLTLTLAGATDLPYFRKNDVVQAGVGGTITYYKNHAQRADIAKTKTGSTYRVDITGMPGGDEMVTIGGFFNDPSFVASNETYLNFWYHTSLESDDATALGSLRYTTVNSRTDWLSYFLGGNTIVSLSSTPGNGTLPGSDGDDLGQFGNPVGVAKIVSIDDSVPSITVDGGEWKTPGSGATSVAGTHSPYGTGGSYNDSIGNDVTVSIGNEYDITGNYTYWFNKDDVADGSFKLDVVSGNNFSIHKYKVGEENVIDYSPTGGPQGDPSNVSSFTLDAAAFGSDFQYIRVYAMGSGSSRFEFAEADGDTEVTCLSPLKAPTDWTVERINGTVLDVSHSTPDDNAQVWVANDNQAGTDFVIEPTNAVPIQQDHAWCNLQIINNKAQVIGIQQTETSFLPVPAKDYSIKFPALFPTGNEPDVDLPRGTCVAAIVAAENSEGRSVKESNCYMPLDVNPDGAAGPITATTPTTLTVATNSNLSTFSPGDNLVMVDENNDISSYTMQTSTISSIVVDYEWNQDQVWSSGTDPSGFHSAGAITNLFDVNESNGAFLSQSTPTTTKVITLPTPVTFTNKVEVRGFLSDGNDPILVNGQDVSSLFNKQSSGGYSTQDVTSFIQVSGNPTQLVDLQIQQTNSQSSNLASIYIDGKRLVDKGLSGNPSNGVTLTLASDQDLAYFREGDVVQGTDVKIVSISKAGDANHPSITVDGGEWDPTGVNGDTEVTYGPVTGTGIFQSADINANTITLSTSNDRWIDNNNRLSKNFYVRDNITVLNADNTKHVAMQQAIASAFDAFPVNVNARRTSIASSLYRLYAGENVSADEFQLLEDVVSNAVNVVEPFALDGYYPLYYTSAKADAASSSGTHHTHSINGVTYYMPDGGTLYHGNYVSGNGY